MISLPSGIGWDDVRQWLAGGWFLFRSTPDGALRPAQLHERHDEYWTVRDLDGRTFRCIRSNTFPFWPQCGAINLDGYAVYVTRAQRRLYRRTYNDQCTSITVPRKWDVMKRAGTKAGRLTPNSEMVVAAVFSPKYYTYSEALIMMESGQAVSVALNPHVIVAGEMVYYRNNLVAQIAEGKITPMDAEDRQVSRILKFFEGRVRL